MQRNPFVHLAKFTNIEVAIFDRTDAVIGDQAAAAQLGYTDAAGLHHVHGARSIIVSGSLLRTEKADGMMTQTAKLVLCTRWADCQNFVIYVPAPEIMGVLHVGWRGVVAEAIPAFMQTLQEHWKIDPAHVFVGAGPSLCARCAEFTDPARELPNVPLQFVQGRHVDLQAAATAQWLACGIHPKHVERHPDCPKCMPEQYWTYRGGHREEVASGTSNMLVAVLKK